MKPIEERANAAWLDYEYKEGELYSTCFIDGFSAGAQSERDELTRWRDPERGTAACWKDCISKNHLRFRLYVGQTGQRRMVVRRFRRMGNVG